MTEQKSFRVPAGRVMGLKVLREQLAALNDLAAELSVTSHPEELLQVAASVRDLYATIRKLTNTTADTGCRWHPGGAVDHAAPEGWGNCLICNTNRGNGVTSSGRPEGLRLRAENMTGATAHLNRPAIRVAEALQVSPAELAQWREPEGAFRPEPERPVLGGFRRDAIDPVYEAARIRARADRAARKNREQPAPPRS
jgi:hypothetical protein